MYSRVEKCKNVLKVPFIFVMYFVSLRLTFDEPEATYQKLKKKNQKRQN